MTSEIGKTEITSRSFGTEVLPREQVRVLIPHNPESAHYNAAVLGKTGELLIVAREVSLAKVRAGTPDMGNLVVYRSTPDSVVEIGKLDLPSNSEVANWEDPRAFTSDEGEDILMGLTAIRASDNKPVAATLKGRIIEGNFQIDTSSAAVCLNDEGKNTTPLSLNRVLFRRNGFPRDLELAEIVKDEETGQGKLRILKTIQFPKKPWCEWQIGTQAQMLPDGILPVHGTNRISLGIDPETKQEVYGYTYSLGLAKLNKNMDLIKVSDEPLFTRDSFKYILPMGQEMDPNKDVIYCCGYSFDGKTVRFAINIGDLMTVEVARKFSDLQGMLDTSKPIEIYTAA